MNLVKDFREYFRENLFKCYEEDHLFKQNENFYSEEDEKKLRSLFIDEEEYVKKAIDFIEYRTHFKTMNQIGGLSEEKIKELELEGKFYNYLAESRAEGTRIPLMRFDYTFEDELQYCKENGLNFFRHTDSLLEL